MKNIYLDIPQEKCKEDFHTFWEVEIYKTQQNKVYIYDSEHFNLNQ